MKGVKQLLLLAALTLLVRCQKPIVSMRPELKQVFTGDLFYLSCENSGSTVKWYLNDTEQPQKNRTLRITAASSVDSGSYTCESNGEKSDIFPITVLGYTPSASLTIVTGQPVMLRKGSVILKIEKDEGLKDWACKVNRGAETRTIKLKLQNDTVSLDFQPKRLDAPETIFWCTDEKSRSNQITIWTSDKNILMEMYPSPAVAGESLTLKCIVWGTNNVISTDFFKNDAVITHVRGHTHTITKVEKTDIGKYKCLVTYKYEQAVEHPHQEVSDSQELFVQEAPVRAMLSEDMQCSCPSCSTEMSYRFYKQNGLSWTMLNYQPSSSGTYRCRAVGSNMRTLPSATLEYRRGLPVMQFLIGILATVALVGGGCVIYYCKKDRRTATGPVYEDVGLRARGGDGGYEALKKKEKEEGEYHTLGAPGAAGGDGGYEALKNSGKQEGEYHTLGAPGTAGGDGGYEALKKSGKQEEEYHTLGAPVAAGGDEGYEALKKSGKQEEEYHTLGAPVAAGGDEGYEALKKSGKQEGEYHTLDTKKAAQVPGKDTEIEIVEE